MSFLPPGAEPHVSHRDPASGELSVHQQAGERAVTADLRDQSATRQEQVEKSLFLPRSEFVSTEIGALNLGPCSSDFSELLSTVV